MIKAQLANGTTHGQKVRHRDAHQRTPDIAGRIGGQRHIALNNIERDKELGERRLIGHRLIEDIRQLHQLRPYAIGQRILQYVRLIAYGRHQIVHLPAGGQHLQQSVVQVVVPVEPQTDRRTAHHRDDREGHLQAGYRVGWAWLPVAAPCHQIKQQSQQRDNQQCSRHRSQYAQALIVGEKESINQIRCTVRIRYDVQLNMSWAG